MHNNIQRYGTNLFISTLATERLTSRTTRLAFASKVNNYFTSQIYEVGVGFRHPQHSPMRGIYGMEDTRHIVEHYIPPQKVHVDVAETENR